MFTRQERCACTPQAHLDLSPCTYKHVPAKRLLRIHAASTLRSLSVRKQTCSCDNTAAFARSEHTWIFFRAQTDMFRRKDCCVLTPGAQLDLPPCARRPVHATTLLRSHAVSALGSHSVRKGACSGEKTAAFSRREHSWIRAQTDIFRRKDCRVFTPRAQHTWISLRAQTRHVHATDGCARTPQAHLDLFPCAKRHVPAKRLLRTHAASTLWISFRAQWDMFHRKACCDLALSSR